MRALRIREPGGIDVLSLDEVPDLAVPPSHVRVRVASTALNRADVLQRRGLYPAPAGAPRDIPGLEYAGVVEAIGEGASRLSVGDRVFGLVGGGAHASHVVVHEREAAKLPASVDLESAGAVPEAFVTAYDALVTRGRLAPGERVLITAVGSGVGTAATQIARAFGCFVAGTSRTQDKLDRAKRLGLDVGVLVGGAVDATSAAISKAAGEGFDVVLELVGGASVEASLAVCRTKARVVVVGLTGGASASIHLGMLLHKRAEVIGTVLRARPIEEKIAAAQVLETTIGAWLDRGIVKPVIDATFPLAEAAQAHEVMERNTSFGKLVLKP